MASTTSLLSSSCLNPLFKFNPFSERSKLAYTKRGVVSSKIFASSSRSRREAHSHDHQNDSSRLVDENMIVLRKRVHEMKMVERNYEPPSDWMEWEKRYYTSYDSIICQLMGLLQSQLMNTRPSFALAFMALITLSIPTSTFMLFFHLQDLFTKALLPALHIIN